MICLLFIFLLIFFIIIFIMSIWIHCLIFCKIHVYSTLYLIMKFLGYAIYLMVDSNDFLTKYFLNNLISCIIFLRFFFSNGNSLIYTVKIFFWQFKKWSLKNYYYNFFIFLFFLLLNKFSHKWSLIIFLRIT